jgi:peptide/nickel transport system permease protein
MPGDPVRSVIHSTRMTIESQEKIRKDFGLDKPIWINSKSPSKNISDFFDSQFFSYLSNLLKGNLGISFSTREEVSKVVFERFFRTVLLTIISELLSLSLGLFIGIYSAMKKNKLIDNCSLFFSIILWASPPFLIGIIILIFGHAYFPLGGFVTPAIKYPTLLSYLVDTSKHMILPIVTLALSSLGGYILIIRSNALDILIQNFILTCLAKGCSKNQIFFKHIFKNVLLPAITIFSTNIGYLFAGAIQVETIFSWPGIGRLIYEAVKKRDYPILQGSFLIISMAIIVLNLIIDLIYPLLDPRIRSENII